MPTNTQNTQTRTPDFFLPLENKSRQSKIGSCPPTNIKHTNATSTCAFYYYNIFLMCVCIYKIRRHADIIMNIFFSICTILLKLYGSQRERSLGSDSAHKNVSLHYSIRKVSTVWRPLLFAASCIIYFNILYILCYVHNMEASF